MWARIAATTILAYDNHAAFNPDGSIADTTDTPSFSVLAKDFAARNLSFANTAGDVGPAIALWTKGNRSHFRHCAFLGYQDTLFLNSKYTYFENCYVEGAVDVIFGRSTAVFQGCTIHSLGYGYLTAAIQGKNVPYGYLFRQCTIQGDGGPDSVFLGRPWGAYAKVVYADCQMAIRSCPKAGMTGTIPPRTTRFSSRSTTPPAPARTRPTAWTGRTNSPPTRTRRSRWQIFSVYRPWPPVPRSSCPRRRPGTTPTRPSSP